MPEGELTPEEIRELIQTASIEEMFDKIMPQRIGSAVEKMKDQLAGAEGTLQFNITGEGGGQWYITIKEGTGSVTKGEIDEPSVTITTAAEDYIGLVRGTSDPQSLFLTGRIQIAGDMQLAMKLAQLIAQLRTGLEEAPAAEAPAKAEEKPAVEEKPAPAEAQKETWSEVMAKATVREVFDVHMPQRLGAAKEELKDKIKGMEATFQFNLTGEGGGQWYITISGGEISLNKGEIEAPAVSLQAEAADYLAMIQRKVDPQGLFLSGKIKLAGDMQLAMRLSGLVREMAGEVEAPTAEAEAKPEAKPAVAEEPTLEEEPMVTEKIPAYPREYGKISVRLPFTPAYRYASGKVMDKFLKELQNKKILGIKCPSCNKVYVPPRSICGHCLEDLSEFVEVKNEGAIENLITAHVEIDKAIEKLAEPKVYAMVRLDGANSDIYGEIVHAGKAKVGDKVEVVWRDEPKGSWKDITGFKLK